MDNRATNVISEKGLDQTIYIVTTLKLENEKEYIVYTTDSNETNKYDMYISGMKKEEDGYIHLIEIYDIKEKKLVEDFIKSIINSE